jgi:hypothetical protein
MIGKLIACAALLTTSASAFASHWVTFQGGPNYNALLDTDSIRHNGNTAAVWERFEYIHPDYSFKEKVPTAAINIRLTFNCAENTAAQTTFIRYDVSGNPLETGRADGKPQDIGPDTVLEVAAKMVCQ